MDLWFSLSSGDMLTVDGMGLHVVQTTSQAAMRQCFEAVATSLAKWRVMESRKVATPTLRCSRRRTPIEAIRLRPTRLQVFRRGKRVAQSPAATSVLVLPGRPQTTSLMHSGR